MKSNTNPLNIQKGDYVEVKEALCIDHYNYVVKALKGVPAIVDEIGTKTYRHRGDPLPLSLSFKVIGDASEVAIWGADKVNRISKKKYDEYEAKPIPPYPQPIYALFDCNEWKDRASFSPIIVTTSIDMLRYAIKERVKNGIIEVDGFKDPNKAVSRLNEISADLTICEMNTRLSYAHIEVYKDGEIA